MIFCPECSSELSKDGDGPDVCPEDATHDLATDTPEFCRSHGYPVGHCAGCRAEMAEDFGL